MPSAAFLIKQVKGYMSSGNIQIKQPFAFPISYNKEQTGIALIFCDIYRKGSGYTL